MGEDCASTSTRGAEERVVAQFDSAFRHNRGISLWAGAFNQAVCLPAIHTHKPCPTCTYPH